MGNNHNLSMCSNVPNGFGRDLTRECAFQLSGP
jgi:hypothetical protein